MPKTTKLQHVGELILELDAWMQRSIWNESSPEAVKSFEDARNILADRFPNAVKQWAERQKEQS